MLAHRMLAMAAVVVALAACSAEGGNGGETAAAGAPREGAVLAQADGAPTDAAAPGRGVTVTGTGRVAGEPDTLRATIGVEVERPAIQPALEAANAAAKQLLDTLRAQGVEEADIQTTQFSVHPRREHGPDEQPRVRGYVVTNLVEVAIDNLERAGEVLTAAVEAVGDAARVHEVRLTTEDSGERLEAARAAAFADARAKAEQYADLADRALGPLVAVRETTGSPPPPVAFEALREEAAAAPVPIAPGEQETVVHVVAVWELE